MLSAGEYGKQELSFQAGVFANGCRQKCKDGTCANIAQLKESVLTYLYIREVHLEHVGAWVPGVEKHELGFLQVVGREALLDLKMAAVKDFNRKEVMTL